MSSSSGSSSGDGPFEKAMKDVKKMEVDLWEQYLVMEAIGPNGDPTKAPPYNPGRMSAMRSSIKEELERLHALEKESLNTPAAGFFGLLSEGDTWQQCPYDSNHKYMKPRIHLTRCRDQYEAKKKERGEEMDIGICQHNWIHHVPMDKLEEHEASCDKPCIVAAYMRHYLKRRELATSSLAASKESK